MNYYDVLRIDKSASSQEIKDSYKKLIKRYHPDLYPGNKTKAESITRDLNEAYDVLSDPEKRTMYDLSLQKDTVQEYKEPITYYTQYYTEKRVEPEEYEKPGFAEKLKESIHSFVDKKIDTLSKESKQKFTFIVILLALVILLISLKDFLDFQIAINSKELENIIQTESYIQKGP